MRPRPRPTMPGSTSRVQSSTPFRGASTLAHQAGRSTSHNRPRGPRPRASFTSRSMGPSRDRSATTAHATEAGSVTSATAHEPAPPAARRRAMAVAASSREPTSRPTATPRSARDSANEAPRAPPQPFRSATPPDWGCRAAGIVTAGAGRGGRRRRGRRRCMLRHRRGGRQQVGDDPGKAHGGSSTRSMAPGPVGRLRGDAREPASDRPSPDVPGRGACARSPSGSDTRAAEVRDAEVRNGRVSPARRPSPDGALGPELEPLGFVVAELVEDLVGVLAVVGGDASGAGPAADVERQRRCDEAVGEGRPGTRWPGSARRRAGPRPG